MAKPRRPRKPPGAGPEQAKRDHYLRLMAQGMNNSAACREAGINRRTGTRWRYGRTVTDADGQSKSYPPITGPKRAVSGRYLSEDERITIADEFRAGRPVPRPRWPARPPRRTPYRCRPVLRSGPAGGLAIRRRLVVGRAPDPELPFTWSSLACNSWTRLATATLTMLKPSIVYVDAALARLRVDGYSVPAADVDRLSPYVSAHINVDGHYSFHLPDLGARYAIRRPPMTSDQACVRVPSRTG